MLHTMSREKNMTALNKASMNGRVKVLMQKCKTHSEYSLDSK